MKAIETEYAGCRFRSRTEARWAVFFDARGWRWEFEPEGFELPSGRYLPDFRVWTKGTHSDPLWFEVKPFTADCPPDARWADLAKGSELHVLTAYGMHRPGDGCKEAWERRRQAEPHAGRLVLPDGRGWMLGPFWTTPVFDHAWTAASSARFEFGESGGPK